MLYFSLIIAFLYVSLITSFIAGWLRLQYFKKNEFSEKKVFLSVIVAARNEEENIENLINDIINQDLNNNFYELIIVNDKSEDKTFSIVKKFSEKYENINLISVNGKDSGKKLALQKGILVSKGDLIVCTDADCRVSYAWLSTISEFYTLYKPKMIVAPVVFYKTEKIFSFNNLQALEFLSLISSGAGAIGLNRAIMSNGANIIFEKQVYQEFNNAFSKEYVSGDDMLFMLKIKKFYPRKILFLKSKKAIVYTSAQKTVKEFINQRIRWTSKSRAYKDFDVIFTSFVVLFINLILFSNLILGFFDIKYFYFFNLILIIKSIPDIIFFILTSNFFDSKKLLILFIPLQIIYFLYIVFIGIVGNFVKFNWKGRKY